MNIFRFKIKLIPLLAFLLIHYSSAALPSHEEMMLQSMDIIRNTFQVGYAPAEWKEEWLGWNLDKEIEKTKTKIKGKNLSLKEFHHVLNQFFSSPKDYHVSVTFFSTEFSYLPFSVKGASGRYFISSIDRNQLPWESFPFSEGDELITFAGKNIKDIIEEIVEKDVNSGHRETDLALAETILTHRDGSTGIEVPKGSVEIIIKPKRRKKAKHTLSWIYFPEKITPKNLLKKSFLKERTPRELLREIGSKEFLYSGYKENTLYRKGKCENGALGEKYGFLPSLGKIVWENEALQFFHAYIFKSPGGKQIGYVRIPNFLASSELEPQEFGEIISLFEKTTDALIIDQTNNPGGFIFYMYSLLSMLTEVPMQNYKHQINITQKDVMLALETLPFLEEIRDDNDAKDLFGETYFGYHVDTKLATAYKNFQEHVIREWELGKFVMDPCYIFGLDHLQPSKSERYTKPILLLINALDFSCADFFPAMLQDNGRATILGSRTAGAGGYVNETSFLNLLGIESYRYTASIAKRKNGPIENCGIVPDISYTITENDLQNRYVDYVRKIVDTIETMIDSRKASDKIPETATPS